jgi:hypothetical protein
LGRREFQEFAREGGLALACKNEDPRLRDYLKKAVLGLLEERLFAEESEELLGEAAAAFGPEARSASARYDDRPIHQITRRFGRGSPGISWRPAMMIAQFIP